MFNSQLRKKDVTGKIIIFYRKLNSTNDVPSEVNKL